MKKLKKSLALAILVAFGLSFCGVFSEGAMAVKKDTMVMWTKSVNIQTGPQSYHDEKLEQITRVGGDVVAITCLSEHNMEIKGDKYIGKTYNLTDIIQKYGSRRCSGTKEEIAKQFINNGVTVANGVVWFHSYPPNSQGQNSSQSEDVFVAFGRYNDGDKLAVKIHDCRIENVGLNKCTNVVYDSVFAAQDKTVTIYDTPDNVQNALAKSHFTVTKVDKITPTDNTEEENTDEERQAETERQQEEERKSKEIDGYDWKGNSTDDSDTTEDNQDPYVPKTMEYGDVDNKASILVGCDKAEQGGGEGIKCIINLVVDIMTVGVGILSVIGITVVGIQYLTSAGSEEKARKAKHRLFEIVIGVALYAVAYALLKWLLPSF